MSVSTEVELRCDGPEGTDRYSCPTTAVFNFTASAARAEARGYGWRTGLPGGKDRCPDCAPAGDEEVGFCAECFDEYDEYVKVDGRDLCVHCASVAAGKPCPECEPVPAGDEETRA